MTEVPADHLVNKHYARGFLGISEPSLDRLVASGKLRAVRVGLRSVRFEVSELRSYVARNRTGPAPREIKDWKL